MVIWCNMSFSKISYGGRPNRPWKGACIFFYSIGKSLIVSVYFWKVCMLFHCVCGILSGFPIRWKVQFWWSWSGGRSVWLSRMLESSWRKMISKSEITPIYFGLILSLMPEVYRYFFRRWCSTNGAEFDEVDLKYTSQSIIVTAVLLLKCAWSYVNKYYFSSFFFQ